MLGGIQARDFCVARACTMFAARTPIGRNKPRSKNDPSFGDTICGMRSPPHRAFLPHGVSLLVTTLSIAHQKILENQIPFAAGEWSTATAALYFSINRVGSGFDFDHAIERVAVRAMERGWLSAAMHTLPQPYNTQKKPAKSFALAFLAK